MNRRYATTEIAGLTPVEPTRKEKTMKTYYMVAAYARAGTLTQNVKFIPSYGIFDKKAIAETFVRKLNKRSCRGDIYFTVPVNSHENAVETDS